MSRASRLSKELDCLRKEASKKKFFVVEIIGLPGSGKTTLLEELSSMNNDWLECRVAKRKNFDTHSVAYLRAMFRKVLLLINLVVFFFINDGEKNRCYFEYIRQIFRFSMSLKKKIYRLALFYESENRLKQKIKKKSVEVIVLDEGLVHRAISLMLSGATKEDIEKYLDVTPNVDALIYLKVSPETIVGQLRLRDEVCQDFFEDIEHNSLLLDSVIDKVRTTKVITVT